MREVEYKSLSLRETKVKKQQNLVKSRIYEVFIFLKPSKNTIIINPQDTHSGTQAIDKSGYCINQF